MNALTRRQLTREARSDAELDVDSVDLRVVEKLGTPPGWDPVANHLHGQVVEGLHRTPELEDLEADRERARRELARHPSPLVLSLGILAAFVVEVMGAILIMRSLEVPALERFFLGTALACSLVGFTAALSGQGDTGSSPAPRRTGRALVLLLGYSLFVVALAMARLLNWSDEDISLPALFSEGVIMLAVSLGPAWLLEYLIRRLAPARLLSREVRLLTRRIREIEREVRRSTQFLRRHAERHEAYEGSEPAQGALPDQPPARPGGSAAI
jgi:hypothetical protein